MKILRQDSDFIDLATKYACSAACAEALRHGTYTPIRRVTTGDGAFLGWVFSVENARGSRWRIQIMADEQKRKYRVSSQKVTNESSH